MKWLDRWIFEGYPARTIDLCVYRVLYSGLMLLWGVPLALWLPHAPRAFFNPPVSIAALFTGFPPFPLIVALNVVLALCLAALCVGWRTRTAAVGTSLSLLALDSVAYSLGKIDHDILLVLTPLVLAPSGWGDSLSVDSRSQPASTGETACGSWSLALLAVLIGISMFGAGWAKATTGWLDPTTRAAWGHLVINYDAGGRRPLLAEFALRSNTGLLWESIDWFTTLLELGFLLAVFRRGVMMLFMSLACLFHLGTWLLFDIVFAWNIIVYGAFVTYSSLWGWKREGVVLLCSRLLRLIPAWVLFMAALLPALVAIAAGKSIASLLHVPLDKVINLIGVVFAIGYLVAIPAHLRLRRGGSGLPETV